MNMKHTPGPWAMSGPYIESSSNETIAQAFHMAGHDSDISLVNARLIAAAPELLSALEILASVAGDSVEYSDWPELRDAIKDAGAAIVKATGAA